MANDERDMRRDHHRHEQARGGGRPQRLGDRHIRGLSDDPDEGSERYGAGAASGYGSDDRGGPMTSDADRFSASPGFDGSFGGPRFDRADVGSTGTHGVHPVSSAFGSPYGSGYGVGPGGYGSSARRRALLRRETGEPDKSGHHDPHYSQWRDRQIAQLDQDYDEYSRERQARFDRDFGEWREQRGQQRQAIGRVREHMEVIGSDEARVGTVDGTRDDRIILTRSDPDAGGVHHSIPCSWIENVDDRVRLNLSGEQALQRWREEEQSQALFDQEDSR